MEGLSFGQVLEFLAAPFVASLILTGIHSCLGLHVVVRGVIFVDLSLAQIASRFGVTERELVLDNQIANRSVIYRGQVVQIRDTSRHPERARILYRVRPGDSLARIAQRLRPGQ